MCRGIQKLLVGCLCAFICLRPLWAGGEDSEPQNQPSTQKININPSEIDPHLLSIPKTASLIVYLNSDPYLSAWKVQTSPDQLFMGEIQVLAPVLRVETLEGAISFRVIHATDPIFIKENSILRRFQNGRVDHVTIAIFFEKHELDETVRPHPTVLGYFTIEDRFVIPKLFKIHWLEMLEARSGLKSARLHTVQEEVQSLLKDQKEITEKSKIQTLWKLIVNGSGVLFGQAPTPTLTPVTVPVVVPAEQKIPEPELEPEAESPPEVITLPLDRKFEATSSTRVALSILAAIPHLAFLQYFGIDKSLAATGAGVTALTPMITDVILSLKGLKKMRTQDSILLRRNPRNAISLATGVALGTACAIGLQALRHWGAL